jgi:hypothetical protein
VIFRNWYRDLVLPVQELDEAMEQWLNTLVEGASTEDEKIERVFRAVRTRVNYVAIEDALNGFRPRPPALVWSQKKGDCKDMANLLCSSLRYVEVDACLAISSTIAHSVDLDFPTLSSADHVICVVHPAKDRIFLDATESACPLGWPSRQIQDRYVLLMDSSSTAPVRVPPWPADSDLVDTRLELTLEGLDCRGAYNSVSHGMAAVPLIDLATSNTPRTVEEALRSMFDATGRSLRPKQPMLNTLQRSATIQAEVEAISMASRVGDKTYLSLAFLPFPHGRSREVPEGYVLLLGEQMLRRLEAHISIPGSEGWKPFEPVHIERDGIVFDLQALETSPGEIVVRYTYRCPYVRIDRDHREAYNEVNAFIVRNLKRTLIHGPN